MKFLIGFGAFVGTFLVYHMIGSSIYPVDQNNVLQAPDIYPIIGIALSILVTAFVLRKWNENYFPNRKFRKRIKWLLMSKERRYFTAVNLVRNTGQASASFLELKFGISYKEAAKLLDQMETDFIVSPFNGSTPRVVYGHEKKQVSMAKNRSPSFASLEEVDGMEGHDFEHWCADLLRKNGFINVEVTQASGDHGVDVLAEKDGVGYAIQCKCYSKDLGNSPVQEVAAGKVMYDRHIGAVMTNRYFTAGAKALAKKNQTLLWDRDKLKEFLENTS